MVVAERFLCFTPMTATNFDGILPGREAVGGSSRDVGSVIGEGAPFALPEAIAEHCSATSVWFNGP